MQVTLTRSKCYDGFSFYRNMSSTYYMKLAQYKYEHYMIYWYNNKMLLDTHIIYPLLWSPVHTVMLHMSGWNIFYSWQNMTKGWVEQKQLCLAFLHYKDNWSHIMIFSHEPPTTMNKIQTKLMSASFMSDDSDVAECKECTLKLSVTA